MPVLLSRRLLLLCIAACLLVVMAVPPVHGTVQGTGYGAEYEAEEEAQISVSIDGLPVSFDVPPVNRDGRVLVPFRAVAEALNVNVSWDGETNTVNAGNEKVAVRLTIDSTTAYRNGEPLTLEVPPEILDGRTLIPLRFFGEAFGCRVHWEGATSSVEITSPPREMTVVGFYALGGGETRSWPDVFGKPYPERARGSTDVLSELALGWYGLDDEGNLLTGTWVGWQRPDRWEDVLDAAVEYNLQADMTVYLTDRHRELSDLLGSEAASTRAVEAIVEEASLYDGVNLNLEEYGLYAEGPEMIELREALNEFVGLLGERLQDSGKPLTLTIHPPNSVYRGYDYEELGRLADRIIIMAYDYGPRPEPVDKVVEAVEMAVDAVAPQKLVLGISTVYENPDSFRTKIGIARRYNLEGVALWRLGMVFEDMWNVLRDAVVER